MDLGLSGKRAIVAASSAGLGLASARALAAEGAIVVINGRDPGRVAAAAALIPGSIPITGDVGTPESAAAFVNVAIERLGGVDILVTNAGGPPPGTFASTPLTAYAPALDLNLMSIVAMCQQAVPHMQGNGWGRVVAITSVSVRQPIGTLILSNTARAGATAFLKTLATEIAATGVTVNSVQPGLHATGRLTSLYGNDLSEVASNIPTRVVGDPADFGAVVAFLCSDYAKFITGAAIPVEGGTSQGLQ